MFRQPHLPCARLFVVAVGLAIGLALGTAGAPAWSQDRSTQERLDRLERDLNMLQRQVYRGAPPPPVVGGPAGAAVNAEIRMERLESQMRDLTGRIEEYLNQVEQIRQRVEQVASDVDARFNEAAAGPGAPGPAYPLPPRPGRQFAAKPPGAADEEPMPPRHPPGVTLGGSIPPGTAAAPPGDTTSGGAAPVFGTLTPPGSRPAAGPQANAAPAGHPATGGVLATGSAADQYNHAFGLLKQADYPAAEAALKAFIEQHANDPMAGNAQYWLGETYYARNRFLEAASAFAEGYKRYPKSAKAADNLLKLAMALGRANQKQNACLALSQLAHDFPNPGAAVREHAGAEKKRLGC